MTKVIFLNGPPRSGKDFSGKILQESYVGKEQSYQDFLRLYKFAEFVKEGTHGAYGLVYSDSGVLPADSYEAEKDVPLTDFRGRTPRECYIAYSEAFMKPLHGPRVFGEILRDAVRHIRSGVVAVTDSGFVPEAEVLVEHFGPGNCCLVRLSREGCSFSGDSRSYIDLSHLSVVQYDIVNPGTPDGLLGNLQPVLEWATR